MYIEYKHSMDKESARTRLNEYIDKMDGIQFAGGFEIEDLKKSWTADEMQFSFNIKKMIIDRRISGTIRLKEQLVAIKFELPSIIGNLVSEENLEKTIRKNLDSIMN